jgi:uncharacterized protein YcgI (DUF1989 family)
MARELVIEAYSGGKIDVKKGQVLEIINVEGEQICDFFAFKADDVMEFLSPSHCRAVLRRIIPKVGDKLVSVYRRPMVEIIEDTSDGIHDIIFPPCDKARYAIEFGMESHPNCRTNLFNAMSSHEIPYAYLPESINFWQNTPVKEDGTIGRGKSTAKPGDKIVLRALMDIIAVGTSCSQDQNDVNAYNPTDIKFVVRDL